MIYRVKNTSEMPASMKGCALTIGVFDSVHKGHQFEIENCISDAKSRGVKSCIVTFDIDPDEKFVPDFVKLMTNDQRILALESSGVDAVVVLEFDKLKDKQAQEFLDEYLLKIKPASIHVGQNFHFGKNQSGNTDLLLK